MIPFSVHSNMPDIKQTSSEKRGILLCTILIPQVQPMSKAMSISKANVLQGIHTRTTVERQSQRNNVLATKPLTLVLA